MAHPFHLAFHVTDLEQTRRFYVDVLGCIEGRSTDTWVDFNFFGHQLSCHLGTPFQSERTGLVDGVKVPMPHFGVVLPMNEWKQLAARLKEAKVEFVYGPTVRYAGEPGEQATLFFFDPSGNPIEIKGFENMDQVFAE